MLKKSLLTLASIFCLALVLVSPSHASAATLYYNNQDGDFDVGNVDNWWNDSGFSSQADHVPNGSDDAFIQAEVDASDLTVHSADFSNGALWDGQAQGLTLTVSAGAV